MQSISHVIFAEFINIFLSSKLIFEAKFMIGIDLKAVEIIMNHLHFLKLTHAFSRARSSLMNLCTILECFAVMIAYDFLEIDSLLIFMFLLIFFTNKFWIIFLLSGLNRKIHQFLAVNKMDTKIKS